MVAWALAAVMGATSGHWAVALSALEKVRPGHLPTGSPEAMLVLSRGECQATQVLIPPPRSDVTALPLALQGPGKLEVRLYREGYVRVTVPSNLEGAPGLWPDPLIPAVDRYRNEARSAFPANSTAEQPLVVYVEVCAAQDAPTGRSTGDLLLEARGVPAARVPVTVDVLRPTVPATSSLPNTFGLSLYSMAKGHGLDPASPAARTLLQDYMRAALSHRLSLHGLTMEPPPPTFREGRAQLDFRAYDAELSPFFEGTALPSGARFTSAELRESRAAATDDEQAAYDLAFTEHFSAQHWAAQLFFYAKDEPTADELPLVVTQARRIHRVPGIPVLVTAPFDTLLSGAADVLCPNLTCFFPRPGPATCRHVEPAAELRARLGKTRLWWYQSCTSHGCGGPTGKPAIDGVYTGWASYMVDHPVALNRAMGPLAFLEGVGGELYFDTVFAYNASDPWQGVLAFGGNGDGTLFYPGTPSRVGGAHHVPVESLRLKAIRDGLQDYEYLVQLAARGDEAFARSAVRAVIRSGHDIERSAAKWDELHRALVKRLDADLRTHPP